jgi:hypothetical protein
MKKRPILKSFLRQMVDQRKAAKGMSESEIKAAQRRIHKAELYFIRSHGLDLDNPAHIKILNDYRAKRSVESQTSDLKSKDFSTRRSYGLASAAAAAAASSSVDRTHKQINLPQQLQVSTSISTRSKKDKEKIHESKLKLIGSSSSRPSMTISHLQTNDKRSTAHPYSRTRSRTRSEARNRIETSPSNDATKQSIASISKRAHYIDISRSPSTSLESSHHYQSTSNDSQSSSQNSRKGKNTKIKTSSQQSDESLLASSPATDDRLGDNQPFANK